MATIELTRDQIDALVAKLQRYFDDELDRELGQFEAEFLLDFLATQLGPYFYNQGLQDAKAIFESRMEAMGEAIYELEKHTG